MHELGDYRRYAIYWAPESGTPLARFGASWFGWDPERRREVPRVELDLPSPLAPVNGRAARYGLHATLRSPFALRPGATAEALDAALGGFAARSAPVQLPPLRLDDHLGFLSLRPCGAAPAVDELAARCVMEFHPFAAPPDAAELRRRRAAGLDAREEALLQRWGYPYVLDAFRFHLTLTGPLQPEMAASVGAALRRPLRGCLDQPLRIASLCLFGDPGGGPFHLVRRYALSG